MTGHEDGYTDGYTDGYKYGYEDGYQVRPETPGDAAAAERMAYEAFGDDPLIPELIRRLRSAGAPLPPLGFVAVAGELVVGHVLLSHGRLDAPRELVDVYTLSPLAVASDHQRRGLGGRLVATALAAADAAGVPLVFLEGAPDYYGRLGFERASAFGFRSPSLRIPDPAFQVRRLRAYAPWMTGTHVYAQTFWDLDCVGLRDPAI
ncbi:GNAT family N-acetyltransferase [Hamadaea tsunoensis]|uniref:GNAT family N-acetyltransferase n=1 Tax=Hamadaea tsunoensis TaxID=53368 RepID=UPI000422BC1C|nr:N-acetyltransferase [Hamadaea tsunoensis]